MSHLKMIVSAAQPYFAPFPGFFYKAFLSDVLVLLDRVQFPRGATWVSRNRLKNDQGTLWITIPVWKKGLGLQAIDEVRICHEGRWERKHLESLKSAYAHAPYFEDHREALERMFSPEVERLIDLNLGVIGHLMGALGIGTKVVLLSELGVSGRGSPLLVEICRKLGASQFLAQGPAARYLDEDLFRSSGIAPVYFRYPPVIYPQLWGEFIPNLSTLDLVLNCGPKARDILIKS